MRKNITIASLAATAAAIPSALDIAASNPCGSKCPNIPSQSYSDVKKPLLDNVTQQDFPYQTFKSSPYQPPALNITGPAATSELDDGYLMFDQYSILTGVKEKLTVMMDNDGELILALNTSLATDFRMQMYKGSPHLTYWTGDALAWGYGAVTFLDDEYNSFVFSPKDPTIHKSQQTLAILEDPEPLAEAGVVDLHEHNINLDGTSMMVTMYNASPADLTPFGVSNGWVMNSLVAEYDVATGKRLFLWNPADHLPFNASFAPIGGMIDGRGKESSPWDWCHVNSIEKVGNDYLVNARHLWATILVSGEDGHIIWQINGHDGGDFKAPPKEHNWSWEHYVRAVNASVPVPKKGKFQFSMYDNHDNGVVPTDAGYSNQLLLELTLPASKQNPAKILRNITVPGQPIMTGSQGSYIPFLPNGNAFVDGGTVPYMREFSPATYNGNNQRLLRQWQFGFNGHAATYRGFKLPWTATPGPWDPSLVVESSNLTTATDVYVSWNGATEVKSWNVYAGATKSSLKLIGKALKKGFETTFQVKENCVQVAAVQGGKEVRKSNVDCTLL